MIWWQIRREELPVDVDRLLHVRGLGRVHHLVVSETAAAAGGAGGRGLHACDVGVGRHGKILVVSVGLKF